jgi:hypothetical protein
MMRRPALNAYLRESLLVEIPENYGIETFINNPSNNLSMLFLLEMITATVSSYRRRWWLLLVALTAAVVITLWSCEWKSFTVGAPTRVQWRLPTNTVLHTSSLSSRLASSLISDDRGDGNVPTLQDRLIAMTRGVSSVRRAFEQALTADYGANTSDLMFRMGQAKSVGRHLFGSFDDISNHTALMGARRKIMTKLVQSVLRPVPHAHANATWSPDDSDIMSMIPLVWATGGNSVAAGHGNLYHESYTSVLEKAMSDAWARLGVRWIARSYASSAAQSAPEAAFCSQALYGTDVDILVWDFSLTDGRLGVGSHHKLEWFLTRAWIMPRDGTKHVSPPLLLALNVYDEPGRLAVLHRLQESGMTVLYARQTVLDQVVAGIPDTSDRSLDEIALMPRLVRKLKCRGTLETADEPNCLGSDKFNPVCPKRLGKTQWHPGW